jgi:polysaccharide deacetylase family protein (PEP-CTERM system associated)
MRSLEMPDRDTLLLTFDVEDWRPLADEWVSGIRTEPSGHVPRQMERIRRILDKAGASVTFFWLASVAELYPELVRSLLADGHEIASHGYSHIPVTKLTPLAFEEDLKRAHEVLGDITGRAPIGFRAPQFSINRRTWWAFEILARNGYVYDSSIFPIRHRRYGVPDFSRSPTAVSTPVREIWELPMATARILGINLPVAGGGYFRLLPLATLRLAIRHRETSGGTFTAYFHPYEFDPEPLALSVRLAGLRPFLRSQLFQQLQNLRRKSLPKKLERIMAESRIEPCGKFVARLMRRQTDAAGFPTENHESKPIRGNSSELLGHGSSRFR